MPRSAAKSAYSTVELNNLAAAALRGAAEEGLTLLRSTSSTSGYRGVSPTLPPLCARRACQRETRVARGRGRTAAPTRLRPPSPPLQVLQDSSTTVGLKNPFRAQVPLPPSARRPAAALRPARGSPSPPLPSPASASASQLPPNSGRPAATSHAATSVLASATLIATATLISGGAAAGLAGP